MGFGPVVFCASASSLLRVRWSFTSHLGNSPRSQYTSTEFPRSTTHVLSSALFRMLASNCFANQSSCDSASTRGRMVRHDSTGAVSLGRHTQSRGLCEKTVTEL